MPPASARGSFASAAPFDLVLANILLGPLQRLATPMARLLAPGARVVLSGLLTSQASAALAAYRAQGLALERRIVLDGWSTLVLRRGRDLDCAACSKPNSRPSTMRPIRRRARRGVTALRTELARRGLDRLRGAARRLPPERISAGVGGAARLAHRLHRLGRRRDRADGARGAVRRRPLHACRRASRSTRRCSRSCIWSRRRPTSGSSARSARATRSASIRGCTPSKARRSSPRACANAGATLVADRAQSDRRIVEATALPRRSAR